MKKAFKVASAIFGALCLIWVVWSIGEVAMHNTEAIPQYSDYNFFMIAKSIMQ